MINTIKQTLLRKEYKILSRQMEMNVVGIRRNNKEINKFDDRITLFYKDAKGNEQFHSFPATTDPGRRWLLDPMNTKGTAVLKEGQYLDAYMLGMHRQKYRGLIQRLPVTVYRDANKDAHIDTGPVEETGMFGINIHRAAKYTAVTAVDQHSAGCQVFQSPTDFALFMGLCDWHRRLYGNVFTYTLLEEGALAGSR